MSLHKLVLSRANLYLKLLLLAIRREINKGSLNPSILSVFFCFSRAKDEIMGEGIVFF